MTNNEARIVQRLRELNDLLKEAENHAAMGWGDNTLHLINQARLMVGDITADLAGKKVQE